MTSKGNDNFVSRRTLCREGRSNTFVRVARDSLRQAGCFASFSLSSLLSLVFFAFPRSSFLLALSHILLTFHQLRDVPHVCRFVESFIETDESSNVRIPPCYLPSSPTFVPCFACFLTLFSSLACLLCLLPRLLPSYLALLCLSSLLAASVSLSLLSLAVLFLFLAASFACHTYSPSSPFDMSAQSTNNLWLVFYHEGFSLRSFLYEVLSSVFLSSHLSTGERGRRFHPLHSVTDV